MSTRIKTILLEVLRLLIDGLITGLTVFILIKIFGV